MNAPERLPGLNAARLQRDLDAAWDGPKGNAHGPNEFLHVPYGKKLSAAVAQVIAASADAV